MAVVELGALMGSGFLGWEKDAIHVILCGRDLV